VAYEVWRAQYNQLIPEPYLSDDEKKAAAEKAKAAKDNAITIYDVKMADLIAAQGQGYTVQPVDNSAKPNEHPYTAYKNPEVEDRTLTPRFPQQLLPAAAYPVLSLIGANNNRIQYKLRSFEFILYAVAKEDQDFAVKDLVLPLEWQTKLPGLSVVAKNPLRDREGALAQLEVKIKDAADEKFSARPILRLTDYSPDYQTVVKVCHQLGEKSKDYKIGGFECEKNEDAYEADVTPSNRNPTEFTLLSYLFNQASIDSTKLPVQQIIQVR
jgi:hypothetical protein